MKLSPWLQGSSLFQKPSSPYSILLKYLELVLYDEQCWDQSLKSAEAADSVLQLYAEFSPHLLPHVLLDSWLQHCFSPGEPSSSMADICTH